MRDLAKGWSASQSLMLLPLAALALVLAMRSALGIQADPLYVIAAFFGGMGALIVAVRHPAALVTPVLFIPRLKEVSALNDFGPLGAWTALEIGCGLLGAGICVRWLARSPRWKQHDAAVVAPISGLRHAATPVTAFLSFASVVAFSWIYTPSPGYGADKLIEFPTLGCGLFFAAFMVFQADSDFRDFIIGSALFGLATAASSLSFSATGAMGSQDNPAHIGKGQVIGLAILLLVYARIQNRWLRLLVLGLLIPALAIGLISAETRGPLFSLLLVLLLSFLLDSFRSPMVTRRQMAFVGAALIGAMMLLSTFWFYGEEASRFKGKSTEIVNLVEGYSHTQGTAVERLVFYRAAFELWSEKPVFGWGVGGWSMAYWHRDERLYPHNVFLEILVEQGIVGELALWLFLGAVFRMLRIHLSKVKERFPFLLPVFVYLVSIAQFSGDLEDDRFIWFWCGLVLACCTLVARAAQRIKDSPANARDCRLSPRLSQRHRVDEIARGRKGAVGLSTRVSDNSLSV